MLRQSQCSIYEHRPGTCRDYDCRVFAAAGLLASGPEDSAINQRVRRWRFSYATKHDQDTHQAVKDAAAFIQQQASHFPDARVPMAPGDIAILAVKAHAVFLEIDSNQTPQQVAQAIIRANHDFGDAMSRSGH